MAQPASVSRLAVAAPVPDSPRHSAVVRITHWVTTLSFFCLLVSGTCILISHPRLYWGEAGNVRTPSLFDLPIPASRESVPTGYKFVLPDQNGWSRYLHFLSAWIAVLTMNGGDLPVGHVAPIRMRLPRQLGYKSVKYLTHLTVTDSLKGFGKGLGSAAPEEGYSWYAGI